MITIMIMIGDELSLITTSVYPSRSDAQDWLGDMWSEVEKAKYVSIWRLPLFTFKQVNLFYYMLIFFTLFQIKVSQLFSGCFPCEVKFKTKHVSIWRLPLFTETFFLACGFFFFSTLPLFTYKQVKPFVLRVDFFLLCSQ